MGTSRGHVLLAEDDNDYRQVLVDWLRHAGFEVTAFRDGGELLDAVFATTTPPFVVLTDLFMPGESGFDVVAELRRTDLLPVIPVGVHSASAWDAYTEKDVVAISKPVELGDLLIVLDCLCADAEKKKAVAALRLGIARRRRLVRTG